MWDLIVMILDEHFVVPGCDTKSKSAKRVQYAHH